MVLLDRSALKVETFEVYTWAKVCYVEGGEDVEPLTLRMGAALS